MTKSRLHGLAAAGQSIWSDQISRSMLNGGELARRVSLDAVTGVTTNPTIFAGAITKGSEYDRQLGELAASGVPTAEVVAALMTTDIQDACDVLRPVWEFSQGEDGFVSVEVSPALAHDTEGTAAEAREWVKRIDRPNLLVKVPATAAGIPAVRRLIGEGISINITLIFSLDRYRQVIDAYQGGLEDFRAAGGKLSDVASVASFFVSRVDTEVDRRLTGLSASELAGTAAIANARMAYRIFLEAFRSDRWMGLSAHNGRLQRPLWASTSTKNPDYPDTKYVTGLLAPHTVNTMPLETIDAYQDHGLPLPVPFGEAEMENAEAELGRLTYAGIDYDDVVATLEREGVEKFAASFDQLVREVERKAAAITKQH
jgi:transaldolase